MEVPILSFLWFDGLGILAVSQNLTLPLRLWAFSYISLLWVNLPAMTFSTD